MKICFNCQFWIPEQKYFKPHYNGYCFLSIIKKDKGASGKITDRNYVCNHWLRLKKRKTIKDMNDYIFK